MNKANTLCWDCENCIGGCSWSKDFEPVVGWKAEAVTNSDNSDTYFVHDCPQFKQGNAKTKLESDVFVRLTYAIIKQMVNEYKNNYITLKKTPMGITSAEKTERKVAEDEFNNVMRDIKTGIMYELYGEDFVEKAIKEMNEQTEEAIKIMDLYSKGVDMAKLESRFGKKKVKETVKMFSRHPIYKGKRLETLRKMENDDIL